MRKSEVVVVGVFLLLIAGWALMLQRQSERTSEQKVIQPLERTNGPTEGSNELARQQPKTEYKPDTSDVGKSAPSHERAPSPFKKNWSVVHRTYPHLKEELGLTLEKYEELIDLMVDTDETQSDV